MESTTTSPSLFGMGYSAQRYANERAIMANRCPQGAQMAAWRQSVKAQTDQQGAATRSG